MVPTTAIASPSHRERGNLNLPIGLIFGFAGIAGTLMGAYSSGEPSSAPLRKLLGLFMIAMGVPMAMRGMKRPGDVGEALPPLARKEGVLGSGFGILLGMRAGPFGVSGTPPVIAGLCISGFPPMIVVGTSALVLFGNSVSGLTGHIIPGQFDLISSRR